MIIGFIGFGKVSRNLAELIDSEDVEFITSIEGRSDSTIENIDESKIEVLPTFKEVAAKSDILISATSPKAAADVAKAYGKFASGIYLDLNNISLETTLEIDKHVENLVDGAIIGKIDSDNPTLYISGKTASKLLFLDEFLDVKVISEKAGDVAVLKLLRSSYTKTLTALLIESFEIAQKHDLENEFFEIVSLTEGDDFKEKSLSRITNTLKNPKRKAEELEEIISCFDDGELIMVKSALEKLNQY